MTEQQLLLYLTRRRLEVSGLSLTARPDCGEPWLSAEGSIVVSTVQVENLGTIFKLVAQAIGLEPKQWNKFSANCAETVLRDLHRSTAL